MCWQIKNNTLYYSMLSLGNVYFLIFVFSSIWLNAKTNFIVTLKSCVTNTKKLRTAKKRCVKNTKIHGALTQKSGALAQKNIVNQNNTNVISHT